MSHLFVKYYGVNDIHKQTNKQTDIENIKWNYDGSDYRWNNKQKYKYIKQVDKIRQKDHYFTKNKTSRKANKRTNRQSFYHVFSTEPDRGGEG